MITPHYKKIDEEIWHETDEGLNLTRRSFFNCRYGIFSDVHVICQPDICEESLSSSQSSAMRFNPNLNYICRVRIGFTLLSRQLGCNAH
jgi:hypothetical protein